MSSQEQQDAARRWWEGDVEPEQAEALRSWVSEGMGGALEGCLKPLEFGTAGLRGVLGPGPGRMNRSVVRRTSYALGQYLLRTVPDARMRGVVVGRDARMRSDVFAEDTVGVFSALGFRVWWWEKALPTPLTAFAVRALGAAGGVVVTASHNPPAYNGYKVYGPNGAQIVPPADTEILGEIQAAPPAVQVPFDAGNRMRVPVPEEVYKRYLERIDGLRRARVAAPLRVAYTPLHGVGGSTFVEAAYRAGFHDVHVVPSQAEPDGRFPTVAFPNPEEPGALDEVSALALSVGADLIIANDPDADRLSLAVVEGGRVIPLSGDETGALLGWHLMSHAARGGRVATTVVSSSLLPRIAERLGFQCARTLTGFKWLALEMERASQDGVSFIFAYEEALGYACGDVVWDKDGIGAALVALDLAAMARSRGQSLLGVLGELQREFGLYLGGQVTLALAPAAADAGRREVMARVRGNGLAVTGHPWRRVMDGLAAEEGHGALPRADLVVFEGEDLRIMVRPSGTEPKVKVYLELRATCQPGEAMGSARTRGGAALDTIRAQVLSQLTV